MPARDGGSERGGSTGNTHTTDRTPGGSDDGGNSTRAGHPERVGVPDPVERALADVAAGRPVVVLDAADRENEADLIMAADHITAEQMGLFIRHTSGVICAAMPADRAASLGLPLMVAENAESMRTAFTVTVDAATGVTTGISAGDRARTMRMLADPATGPGALVRPGHVFGLRAHRAGVLGRPGHTEAAVDLCMLAGREPVGVLAELVADSGEVLRAAEARAFADANRLTVISIADLVAYRRRTESVLRRVVSTVLPTPWARWVVHGYESNVDRASYVALVAGDPAAAPAGAEVLVRVHSECLTGDVFGSMRCDCGPQLQAAQAAIAEAGTGVLVYLRGHEGRGIGLLSKLSAYVLQDAGLDTLEANLALGLPADARDYWAAAQILVDLRVGPIRLLTNNPAKRAGLESYGVQVAGCTPLRAGATEANRAYLATKRDRLGHTLPLDDPLERV